MGPSLVSPHESPGPPQELITAVPPGRGGPQVVQTKGRRSRKIGVSSKAARRE